jgi:NAD-dependent DNA ligase
MTFFTRQAAAYRNTLQQSCGALVGIASGVLADGVLNDQEIRFIEEWLRKHEAIANEWPGDVLYARVKEALADGQITEDERAHLAETLQQIAGGSLERLAERGPVNQLAFDEDAKLSFGGSTFCLTGNFVFGPRPRCVAETAAHGGVVVDGVTKKLNYLVVGALGSDEWKHGSFGTKIEKAVAYKRSGAPLFIVREDHWMQAL